MTFNPIKEKEVSIIELVEGEVFKMAGKDYSFVRIKRGGQSMVVTQLDNGKDYSVKIHYIYATKTVIGKINKKVKVVKKENSSNIQMSDIQVDESVIIMTGRKNQVPQLYKLVEIKPANKWSHVFINPVTKRKEQFNAKDMWKVYRLNDLLK